MTDDGLIVVALVGDGSVRREIHFTRRPTPQQVNLLHVLCEHVGRTISLDDICHRMKCNLCVIRFHACRLRQKLSDDWMVDGLSNNGYRLLYVGGDPLISAATTRMELRPESLARPPRRHTPEHRENIRQGALERYRRPSSRRVRLS